MGEGTQGSSLRAAGRWLLLPIAAERKPHLPDVSWTSPFAWWSSQGHTNVIAHVQPGNLALGPPPRQVSQPAAQMWERGPLWAPVTRPSTGCFSGASCTSAPKASASDAFCMDRMGWGGSPEVCCHSPTSLEPLLCQLVGRRGGSEVRSMEFRASLLLFWTQICHFVSHRPRRLVSSVKGG